MDFLQLKGSAYVLLSHSVYVAEIFGQFFSNASACFSKCCLKILTLIIYCWIFVMNSDNVVYGCYKNHSRRK